MFFSEIHLRRRRRAAGKGSDAGGGENPRSSSPYAFSSVHPTPLNWADTRSQ